MKVLQRLAIGAPRDKLWILFLNPTQLFLLPASRNWGTQFLMQSKTLQGGKLLDGEEGCRGIVRDPSCVELAFCNAQVGPLASFALPRIHDEDWDHRTPDLLIRLWVVSLLLEGVYLRILGF